MVIKQKMIYRQDLQQNPNSLYLFGDNEERRSLGGQAIRLHGGPNAVGVQTKRWPRLKEGDSWTNETFGTNCGLLAGDFAPVRRHLAAGGTAALPEDGFGTGLVQLAERTIQPYACFQAALTSLV